MSKAPKLKEEYASVIIKSEPCSDVNYINDKIKVEKICLDKAKPEIDLECIKEESFTRVKKEEIAVKDEILNICDTENDLTDDNIEFTAELKQSPTSPNAETSFSTEEEVEWFQCTKCEFETILKGNLVRHMIIHTGERRFACNVCKFKAANNSDLTMHKRVHTGEKPFACNICQFKTARKYCLKQHMLRHTGEKPFACNFCEFKTTRNWRLKEHKRIYTGEKPFACNLCEFKYARPYSLRRHIITHMGKKPLM